MIPTEKTLENRLFDACKRNGIKCVKGQSRSNRGFPDRVLFDPIRNRIFYVELKNETYYKQTPQQKDWQKTIEKSGGQYVLLDGEEQVKLFIINFVMGGHRE